MADEEKPRHSHLTLIEVILVVIVLGVAGFFLVRNVGIAREREQRRQITEALQQWWGANRQSEQKTKAAERLFALVKANPKLHDAKSNYGFTPLHVAAAHGNRDIAQWLLDHGADVNANANNGATPLHVAAEHGNRDIAQWLLDHGADVNAKANFDWTPLHWAANNGHKEVVELLLAKGADVNAKDKDGLTPLDRANGRRQQQIIDLLRKHGAKE